MADKVPEAAGNGAMLVKPTSWEALRRRVEDIELIPDPKDFSVATRGGKKFIRLRGVRGSVRPSPPPLPPFLLGAGKTGARIYQGVLEWSVTKLNFERVVIRDRKGAMLEEINHFSGQDAISGVQVMPRGDGSSAETGGSSGGDDDGWWDLDWWGQVWAKISLDPESGEPTGWDIVGPAKPAMREITALDGELSRGSDSGDSGGETGYAVLLGTVPENGGIVQERTGNLEWFCAFVPENEASSDGGESGGSDESGDSGESGGEKSSNAIVRMPWNEDGYGALATTESSEVLLEFPYRHIPLTGPLTRVAIDPRHVFVCEPGSLEVLGAPVGPKPCVVGAEVVGNEILLRTACLGNRANSWVNLKLTGVRRGFADWNMPNRTAAQKTQADATNAAAYDR